MITPRVPAQLLKNRADTRVLFNYKCHLPLRNGLKIVDLKIGLKIRMGLSATFPLPGTKLIFSLGFFGNF